MKLNDLTGQTFGRLTVLYRGSPKRNGQGVSVVMWRVKCSCGNEKEVSAAGLRGNKTRSCGCSKTATGIDNHNFKGYGEIPASVWCSIKSCYANSKSIKKRGLEFNVSIEQVWHLFLKQNRKCALSGLELSFTFFHKRKQDRTTSLDRIDSSKGYTIDNVQWVHKRINAMKSALTDEEFTHFCCKVAEHNGYSKVQKGRPSKSRKS
jgi:hypothetical protein